jgi:hypothetical protein
MTMADRMFRNVERWNPVTGCTHRCKYSKKDPVTGKRKPMCWARGLAETRLKHSPRYKFGFDSYQINEDEFHPLKEHTTYFVCSMGDLFAVGCPPEYREAVFAYLEGTHGPEAEPNCPDTTTLLFLTKNPEMYKDEYPGGMLGSHPPDNYVFGATIETNRDDPGHEIIWGNAPLPIDRLRAMQEFRERNPNARLFLSIEPIMEFDTVTFVQEIERIQPEWVYIGLDNHHADLPEPEERQIWELVYMLSKFTEPRIKGQLYRIND